MILIIFWCWFIGFALSLLAYTYEDNNKQSGERYLALLFCWPYYLVKIIFSTLRGL